MPMARIYRGQTQWHLVCRIGHPPSLLEWTAPTFPDIIALYDWIVGYLRGDSVRTADLADVKQKRTYVAGPFA